MKTIKKAQTGAKVNKSKQNPADEYKGMKDAKGKPAVNVGGEGKKPPVDKNSPVLPLPGRKAKNMPKQKSGGSIKKAQSGTSVDRNTPSDISKMRQWYKDKNTPGKDRNTPAQVKKMRESYKSGEMAGKKAKSGAFVKKCKYGCK